MARKQARKASLGYKQDDGGEPPSDSGKPEDLVVTPDDCNVYNNIIGTKWGANKQAALNAASAEANSVYNALKVQCPKGCPIPKKGKSVGKPTENKIVIDLPFFGAPIVISLGWVCDYEIVYGCFTPSDSEPV